MALGELTGTDLETLTTDLGVVQCWCVAQSTLVCRVTGTMTLQHAEMMMRYSEIINERNGGIPAPAIHDWLGLENYHSNARLALPHWLLRNRGEFTDVHLASTSKMVSMGVAVANIAVGGIIEHHTALPSLQRSFDLLHAPVAQRARMSWPPVRV